MARRNLLKGNHPDIVNENIKILKDAGYAHHRAVGTALRHANRKNPTNVKRVTTKITKQAPAVVKIKGPGDFNV